MSNKEKMLDNKNNISSAEAAEVFRFYQENPTVAAKDLLELEFGLPWHQRLALKVSWGTPNNIFVWSRGSGKSKSYNVDSIVLTRQNGIQNIVDLFPNLEFRDEEYWHSFPVMEIWNGDGWQSVDKMLVQKQKVTKKIKTHLGYSIEGSADNHRVQVLENGRVIWQRFDTIKVGQRVLIGRNQTAEWESQVDADLSYLVGLIIGDGCVGDKGIAITNIDEPILAAIEKYSCGKRVAKKGTKAVDISLKADFSRKLREDFGLPSGKCLSYDKTIPPGVKKSKSALRAFLQGLFDTDGNIEKAKRCVSLCSVSEQLIHEVQVALLTFGIISKKRQKATKSKFGKCWILDIGGVEAQKFVDRVGFRLGRKQSVALEWKSCLNTNIDVIPDIKRILIELKGRHRFDQDGSNKEWRRVRGGIMNRDNLTAESLGGFLALLPPAAKEDPDYKLLQDLIELNKDYYFDEITSIELGEADCIDFNVPVGEKYWANGFINHNTWFNGMYALLRALLYPNEKVGIFSASFRQAKFVWAEIEKIYDNSPIVRELCAKRPTMSPDKCYLKFKNGSIIDALPIGDGCLSPNEIVLYEDRFGTIAESNPQKKTKPAPNKIYGLGQMRHSDEMIYNKKGATVIIETEHGFQIEGTPNHAIKVRRNGDTRWVRFSDIEVGDQALIDRSIKWHSTEGLHARQKKMDASQLTKTHKMSKQEFILVLTASIGSNAEIPQHSGGIKFWCPDINSARLIHLQLLCFGIVAKRTGCSIEMRQCDLSAIQQYEIEEFRSEPTSDIYFDPITSLSKGSSPTYDLHVPSNNEYFASGFFSHNSKIRGARYFDIVADEAAQIPEDVFDIVIRGMTATSKNPTEEAARIKAQEELLAKGLIKEEDLYVPTANRILMSSTAFYRFNHLWKRVEIFDDEIRAEKNASMQPNILVDNGNAGTKIMWNNERSLVMFDYMDPPKGFMKLASIKEAKLKMSENKFNMEYRCIFPPDSEGFFRRSKIERARNHDLFTVELKGKPGYNYVLGIDVARKSDNFAISVGRIAGDALHIVNVITLNSKSFSDMYNKIRQVLGDYNVIHICMDTGGGGTTLEDMLEDERLLSLGEKLVIDSINNPEKEDKPGLHILDMVKFSDDSIPKMAFQMSGDLDHGRLLLPCLPNRKYKISDDTEEKQSAKIAAALKADEDAYEEIEELIEETASIIATSTRTGKVHLGLPSEVVGADSKRDYDAGMRAPRKDRWTSCMLCCWAWHRCTNIDKYENSEEPAYGFSMRG